MNADTQGPSQTTVQEFGPAWFRLGAWLSIPLILVTLLLLWGADLQTSYERPYLLMSLNFLFSVLTSLFIAYLIARSFLVGSTAGLLLIGCGVVIWGAAAFVGISTGLAVDSGHDFDNISITVHNTSVWLSGICFLAGVILSYRPKRIIRAGGLALSAGYTCSLGAVGLVTLLALGHLMPTFFVQGVGGTALRWFILGSSMVMFALTAVLVGVMNRRSPSQFLYWYGLALALIATGLFGIMIEKVHGGPLSWVGRGAQLLSGIYMLIAAVASVRENGVWGIPLETALQESEKRYQSLFNSMTEGFALHEIICDETGTPVNYRFLDINPAFERLTGLKRQNIIGRTVNDILPGDDPKWVRMYGEVALTGVPVQFENYSPALRRWYEVYAYQPASRQFAVTFMDITDRKQSEEALRQSEERFRAMADAMPQLAWVANPDGWIHWYNRGWYEYTGTTLEQMDGWGWQSVHDPEALPKILEQWKASLATGEPFEMVFPLRGADGRFRRFLTRGHPMKDSLGRVVQWFGTNTDVDELKRTEEALKESEQRHRLLAETMLQGVVHQDADGKIIAMNPAAEVILGKTREQFLGSTSVQEEHDTIREDGQPFPGEEHPAMVSLRTGQQVRGVIMGVFNPKVGEYRWIRVDAVPLLHPGQTRPSEVYTVFEDITERKQSEEAQRKQAEEALHMSEQEFHSLAEAMPQIVWATRPDGWNIYFNQQWVDYTGMTMEESYGHGWNTPFHPDDRHRAWEAWQNATQHNDPYALECRLRRADGVYRWWLVRGLPMLGANGEILKWFGTCTDIEEIKRAEAALREANDLLEQRVAERTTALGESEERLRFALQTIQIGAWDLDLVDHTAFRSLEHDRIFGYAELLPEWTYEMFLDHVLPEDRPAVDSQFRQAMETNSDWNFECRIRRTTGEIRWIMAAGRHRSDDAGAPRRMAGIVQDITTRKQAEEALKESEERFHAMFERHHAVKLVIEPETGIIVDANAAACRFYGYSREQLCSLRIHDINQLPPDEVASERAKAAAEQRNYFVFPHRLANGEVRWVEVYSTPVETRGRPLLYSIIHDITNRTRAEEALRESERMYRAIGESIDYGVWICDPEGRNLYASDSFLKLVGISQQQCSEFGWGDALHPDDAERTMAAWKECVRTGGTWDIEHRFRGVDGEWYPVLARGVPVRNVQGQIVRWVGINLDIGNLKRTEEALKASLGEKEVLLKEIHHRVKNNMQIISSLVDLQASQLPDDSMRAILQDVTQRVRSMALVHEKLYQSADMARIEFSDYARTLLGYLWRAHGTTASGIRLALDLEPTPFSVNAAVPCALILNELATNALKHAFRGRNSGEVIVSLHRNPEGLVSLRIRDNGTGFPAGLDWQHAKSLGLRLVQILAKQLSATVEFSSVDGEGTEFSVSFGGPNL